MLRKRRASSRSGKGNLRESRDHLSRKPTIQELIPGGQTRPYPVGGTACGEHPMGGLKKSCRYVASRDTFDIGGDPSSRQKKIHITEELARHGGTFAPR